MLVRFFVRTSILVFFAAFASTDFAAAFAALLWMSIILLIVIGVVRREQPFGAGLNHWDEAVAYAALFALLSSFNLAVPA